jgi:hypothetical protein
MKLKELVRQSSGGWPSLVAEGEAEGEGGAEVEVEVEVEVRGGRPLTMDHLMPVALMVVPLVSVACSVLVIAITALRFQTGEADLRESWFRALLECTAVCMALPIQMVCSARKDLVSVKLQRIPLHRSISFLVYT